MRDNMVIPSCGQIRSVVHKPTGGNTVPDEKVFGRHVWKIIMVLSVFFILWTIFMISRGDEILPTAFRLAGSSQSTEDLGKSALEF